jgi:hypothetical protein
MLKTLSRLFGVAPLTPRCWSSLPEWYQNEPRRSGTKVREPMDTIIGAVRYAFPNDAFCMFSILTFQGNLWAQSFASLNCRGETT